MPVDILDFITPGLFNIDDGPIPSGTPTPPLPPAPYLPAIGAALEWEGYDVIALSWNDYVGESEGEMIQLDRPIRQYNRIPVRYTFRNAWTGVRMDITPYHHVIMHAKLNGQLYSVTPAEFYGSKTRGGVQVRVHSFDLLGKWDVQFVLYDNEGRAAFSGDPVQFDVVVNVRNAALAENLSA